MNTLTSAFCLGCLNEDPPLAVRRYRIVDHGGQVSNVLYCDDCAALARVDWNGETAEICEAPFRPTHRVTYWLAPHRPPATIAVKAEPRRDLEPGDLDAYDEAFDMTISLRGGRWHWRGDVSISAFEVTEIEP